MSTEATSALTNGDLILEVARKMGVAFYGDDGTEEAQVPHDDHDLAECQRHVNNGIRMFLSDAPATGWRWTRPTATVALWPDVTVVSDIPVTAGHTVTGGTYDAGNDRTPITANTAVFTAAMVGRTITVTGQGTFTITVFNTATQIYVSGSHTFATAATYSITSGNSVSGVVPNAGVNETLVTANTSAFYESMEEKSLVVTGSGTYVIKRYVSTTQVYLYGKTPFTASTYSITSDGDFTLPRTFAGTFTGEITFAAQTNRAVQIQWSDEATIRELRENVSIQTGIPRYLAVNVFVPQSGRRRFKLMSYPTPYQLFNVQFPYDLHFDELLPTDLTSTPPTPIAHDETIRAACLAVVERDVDDGPGENSAYYEKKCLPNSLKIDSRSGPRKLGYFGNDRVVVTPRNFREFMKRPNVTYNTP